MYSTKIAHTYTNHTHKKGHWMGLEHTFKNGCGGDGDFVDDTPEVAEANYGDYCYDEVDSCPNDGLGADLLDFMDYLDDVCLSSFTRGQKERMVIHWNEYRGGGAEVPDADYDYEYDYDYECCGLGLGLEVFKGAIGV